MTSEEKCNRPDSWTLLNDSDLISLYKCYAMEVSDRLIKDGVKEMKSEFGNGFVLILKDKKSSRFRAKERKT